MRSVRFPGTPQSEKGSILATTFLLTMLAAMAAMWMVATLYDHQRSNQRRREADLAFFFAESGIERVMDWGNNPDDYTGGTTTSSDLFYRDPVTGLYPNLTSATLTSTNVPADKLWTFEKDGVALGSVESITLMPPEAGDPTCGFKVRSVGATPSGMKRAIIVYLTGNGLTAGTELALPAGLISLDTAAQAGNGTVHWGQAWSKGDFTMLNKSQCDHLDETSASYDEWVQYRTEGWIDFPSNWQSGVGKDIYQEDTLTSPGAPPASGNYEHAFAQHLPVGTLKWPDFKSQEAYDTFKSQAIAHGRYYTTQAGSDMIYKDGIAKDFAEELMIPATTDRESAPYDMVFIDTLDGTPPKSDKSNLTTINVSGSTQKGLKGVYWVGANFSMNGVGQPDPVYNVEKPDGTPVAQLDDVFLDGVLYTGGTCDMGGNPIVFGSVVAEKGFASGGTPEIYYNHKLEDGLPYGPGELGSGFKTVMHTNEAAN